jgi:uncharacterized membrane protein
MNIVSRAFLTGHPRSFAGLLAGLASYPILRPFVGSNLRAVCAWDIGATVFLLLFASMFYATAPAAMPRKAEEQQEGEWTVFWVMIAAVGFSFYAIVGALGDTSHLPPAVARAHVGLVAATLVLSWMVTQALFAARYAHEYYETKPDGTLRGGLMFPGEDEPDYWDFLYFSVVLGMTFQVSDVQIADRPLRRLAAVQGFLGFLFNTVIIALTVNAAAAII